MSDTAVRRYAPGRARQEELLDAAYALFGEVGFSGVSLRDIAARAGISHASLLRYFSSKDALLLSLLDRWEQGNMDWVDANPELTAQQIVVSLARRNAEAPGYIELFSALAGEATPEQHPAHDHFTRRYEQLRRGFAFAEPMTVTLAALWDGLQIMSLYIDEIDVPAELEAFLRPDAAMPRSWPDPEPGAIGAADAALRPGYAPGRRKREQIVESATELFAERGFTATSMNELARRVGVSKSTLMHHVGSKDALLEAVLQERDRVITERFAVGSPESGTHMTSLLEGARENAVHSGFVELYTVLVCEATSASHPAHEYFAQRFRTGIAQFAELLAAHAPSLMDPIRHAAWFMALWDGLQIQWLYEPDAVDIPAELDAFIAGIR